MFPGQLQYTLWQPACETSLGADPGQRTSPIRPKHSRIVCTFRDADFEAVSALEALQSPDCHSLAMIAKVSANMDILTHEVIVDLTWVFIQCLIQPAGRMM
jgi:hypothetical protein